MAEVTWSVELYGFPHAAGPELSRLEAGPVGVTVAQMEAALAAGFIETETKVHIITGALRASGVPRSNFTGEEWEGEIDYARHPGIFELARGDMPTHFHPDGGHNFFGAYDGGGGPTFERGVRQAVWNFVTDGEGGEAPSEGLEPRSGG